ncbi:MAG: lipoprotein [Rhodanobacter sp.]
MHRSTLLLLALTTAALAGCGNKGPLQLPAVRAAPSTPATTPAVPAVTSTTVAPPGTQH